ncbi:hypothetical protein N7478_005692 [Penicillium angulare]|uniref:uncharacterized protein n=1 Tax=Penicillium angulare TaxID=116970 RepID=UPI002542452C|nr:uncharacterized protein N7478_005692 [Penicillium angulare]KAJ5280320.1 hypothetical protein N7478_005692 [Penicillium angulare]
MHIKPLFVLIATFCTLSAAVPFNHDHALAHNPSRTNLQASSSAAYASSSSTPSMITVAGAYQCPPKQHKSCCTSLEETTKELMKPVSDLVPSIGGISISSKVSFQCNVMDPLAAPQTCRGHGYTPMCCANAVTTSSLDACQPFEKAKKKYYQSLGFNKSEESNTDLINDVLS